MARRTNRTVGDSDSFLPIQNTSINWNNSSGILATATQQDLYLMSIEAGINQSWLEWSGGAHAYQAAVNGGTAVSPYPSGNIPLVGGILALDFAKHIQLTESYFAPGSLGTFNLQIQLQLYNQDPVNPLASPDWEIVVITLNSGVFVCERGFFKMASKSLNYRIRRIRALYRKTSVRLVRTRKNYLNHCSGIVKCSSEIRENGQHAIKA